MNDQAPAVFTTILMQKGRAKWPLEHLARLKKHAKAFGIPYPGDNFILFELQSKTNPSLNQLAKITLSKTLDITTRPHSPPSACQYKASEIILSNICVPKDFACFKTSYRTPYERAFEVAQKEGAFEALLLNDEGYVVDGTKSSPLLFSNETLISLEGSLCGITREKALEKAKELGVRTSRDKLTPKQLWGGTLLVAGSGVGLVPSREIHDERMRKLINLFKTS